MKVQRWQLGLAASLFLLTGVFYAVRWFAFPGESMHNEMVRFLVGDIAFVFLQVLLVTMFIDRVAQAREKDEIRRKLNMVIGAFFSQVGTELLGLIAPGDTSLGEVRESLVAKTSWKPEDYVRAKQAFIAHDTRVDLKGCQLEALKLLLGEQKGYLLGLLGNQALLEHERFTDLLWAVTHLAEELEARADLEQLATPDAAHLALDVKRAYDLLGWQWIDYLAHLHENYPYLFSLAIRTNPLDPEASVTVAS